MNDIFEGGSYDAFEQEQRYEYSTPDYFFPFDIRPISFGGTGDIFSSVLLAEKMNGKDFFQKNTCLFLKQ